MGFAEGFLKVFFAESVDYFRSWGYVVLEEVCFNGVVKWVWLC